MGYGLSMCAVESAVENDEPQAQESARLLQQRWSHAGLLAEGVLLIAAEVEDRSQDAAGFGQCVWAVSSGGIYLQPLEDELALTEFAADWAWKLKVVQLKNGILLKFMEGTGRVFHQGSMSLPDLYFVEILLTTVRGWGKLIE